MTDVKMGVRGWGLILLVDLAVLRKVFCPVPPLWVRAIAGLVK